MTLEELRQDLGIPALSQFGQLTGQPFPLLISRPDPVPCVEIGIGGKLPQGKVLRPAPDEEIAGKEADQLKLWEDFPEVIGEALIRLGYLLLSNSWLHIELD